MLIKYIAILCLFDDGCKKQNMKVCLKSWLFTDTLQNSISIKNFDSIKKMFLFNRGTVALWFLYNVNSLTRKYSLLCSQT